MHHVSCRVFWQNIKSPRWLSPTTAQIWHPVTFALPKTKITFEREDISNHRWNSGKSDGGADGYWENCVRSQGAYFDGDWDVIAPCTMFLVSVSSSINVSIFHSTWLDTFRTGLIYSSTIYCLHIVLHAHQPKSHSMSLYPPLPSPTSPHTPFPSGNHPTVIRV